MATIPSTTLRTSSAMRAFFSRRTLATVHNPRSRPLPSAPRSGRKRTLSPRRTGRPGNSTVSGTCRSKFSPKARRLLKTSNSRRKSAASCSSLPSTRRSRSVNLDMPCPRLETISKLLRVRLTASGSAGSAPEAAYRRKEANTERRLSRSQNPHVLPCTLRCLHERRLQPSASCASRKPHLASRLPSGGHRQPPARYTLRSLLVLMLE